MEECYFSEKEITDYENYLRNEEREEATVEKYLRELQFFRGWLADREVTKEEAIKWKEHLQEEGYAPATINAKLSALNGFFLFMGWGGFKVRFLKIQRQIFRKRSKELTKESYARRIRAFSQDSLP